MLIALAYNYYQSQRVFVRLRIEKISISSPHYKLQTFTFLTEVDV